MKNKKEIKTAFAKLSVSKDFDEKVLNNTVNRKKNIFRISKMAIAASSIMIILLVSIGVFAQDISKMNIFSRSNTNDGKKELLSINGTVTINQNSNFNCNQELTIADIEIQLDVKLLVADKQTKTTIDECDVKYNDEKISSVTLTSKDTHNYSFSNENKNTTTTTTNKCVPSSSDDLKCDLIDNSKYINMTISFMTDYADDETTNQFRTGFGVVSSYNSKSSEDLVETYRIKSLNIDAYIIDCKPLRAFLVYNNIIYSFEGNNVNKDEIKSILETLKY